MAGLTDTQKNNLNRILEIIKNQKIKDPITGEVKDRFTAEQAHTAAWMAYIESSFDPKKKGRSKTESGLYQYTDSTWNSKYSSEFGIAKEDWLSNKNDLDLQTKVFLNDMELFMTSASENDGKGIKGYWSNDGLSGKTYAKDSMSNSGVSWTLENYVYLRHNTDLAQEKKVLFNRLLDRDGLYAEIEQSVETAYGKQITDPWDDPSLAPFIKILSETLSIDINGLSNKEAVEKIRASMKSLLTPKELNNLLDCLSGMNICDIAKVDQTIAKVREAMGPINTETRRDPIMLDLDGDGIETTNVKDGAYFDHDGNGFAEQTGWAASDDGMLVMDRNGDGIINDGKELFGDQTILSDGTRAANGFQMAA
ncbi:MAG: hypothetical protein HY957_01975 [Nitrospirae bacterium]|nr:hypothetical protein [Nitrospirota bacterium]